MHVTGWDIDGFGLLGPHRVEHLPEGLVIVTGPNEAGKSTLVSFLRAVLFGFGAEASGSGRFRPVRDGRWGGTVTLETPRGVMTVTRHAEPSGLTVRAGDGGELRPDALEIVLGELDASVFDSVLTVAAPDLDAFAGLEVDEVRERLLSAGSTGGARRARLALAELEDERRAIWSPDGAGVVGQLRDQLREATGRLTEVRRDASNHGQHALEVEQRAEEASQLAEELDDARRAVARYNTILEIWDDYQQGRQARAELESLGELAPLDDDIQVRFERLIAEVEAAERAERDERSRLERADERTTVITVDDGLTELAEGIRQLHAELGAEAMRAERADELARSRRSQETELTDELGALGPDWDRERLTSFTTTLPAAEDIRQWARRIDEQHAHARQLEEERADAEVDEQEAGREAERALHTLDRFRGVPTGADIETAYTTIRRLRSAIADLDRQRAEVSSAENTLAVLETARRRALEQPPLTGLARWLQPLLLTTAVLLILAAGGALFAQQNLAATIAGLTAVVVAGLAFVAPTRPAPPDPSRAGPERIAAATEAVAARRDEAEHLQLVVGGLAAQLQLTPQPSPAEIDGRERDILDYRDARREADRTAEHRLELLDRQHMAAQRRARLVERAEDVRAEAARVEAAWSAWKAERQIPAELDPEGVGELFSAVRRARAAARRLELLEAEAAANEAKRQDFADRARDLLARVGDLAAATDGADHPGLGTEGVPALLGRDDRADGTHDGEPGEAAPPDDATADDPVAAGADDATAHDPDAQGAAELVASIAALAARVEANAEARRELEAAEVERATAAERLTEAEAAAEAHRARLDELLSDVGTSDETGFRDLLVDHRRRRELLSQAERCEDVVARALGKGESAKLAYIDLAEGDPQEWELRRLDENARIERVQSRHEEASARHRDALGRLAAVESSSLLADLQLRCNDMRSQLHEAAERWQALTIAQALIEDALVLHGRHRQPAVLTTAGTLFTRVTDGNYVRLDVGGRGLEVIDAAGRRIDAAHLSRGTVAALYLCIRFALASQVAGRSRLPILLDDVLGDVDPARVRAIAGVIAELVDRLQVFVLTSSPIVRDLLVEQCPSAQLVHLGRYGADPGPDPDGGNDDTAGA